MSRRNVLFTLVVGTMLLAWLAGAAPAASDGPDEAVEIAKRHVASGAVDLGVTKADVADLVVTSAYRSAHNGVTHINLNQRHEGLEVFGGHATVNVDADGRVVFVGGSFVNGLGAGASGAQDVDATEAVAAAADALDLDRPKNLRVLGRRAGRTQETVVSGGGISDEPIPARLGWQPTRGGLRLAWQLTIDDSSDVHLWSATVDAETGKLLEVADWTSEDDLADLGNLMRSGNAAAAAASGPTSPDPVADGSSYRVLDLPKESPNDGPRALVTNPADAPGSPFGWHDTDGAAGAEFTSTRGNNVHAYLDQDNNNAADFGDTEGGPGLAFDFSADLGQHAQNYRDAVVTNLFYTNNVFHDVISRYGFDEASGNFQANNYSRGGVGGDYVRAEAADGGGTNNANFSTPVETPTSGGTPRMQMFLWPGTQFGSPNQVVVDGVGAFDASWSRFGPAPTTGGVSGTLVYAGTGCSAGLYPPEPTTTNWIALVDGGTAACTYLLRVQLAQSLGASAVVVAHNTAAAAPILTASMTTAPVGIAAIAVTQADGNTIKTAIAAGTTTGTVRKHPDHPGIRDGDLENGIIIHEYGHGVSNRLTGGPGVNCLTGQEQMGEGWSDYLAIVMLIDPALDDPKGPRGMGPYALFQDSRRGDGIRPRPYSRNMAIQPFTYDSIKSAGWLDGASLALPHGLGHGWAAVLWDLTWDLIDKHGFNPDIYGDWDSGGNNRALQYVIDGLKFQGCGPGFVVARDAIIAAADLLTDGGDTCTLWASLARRGLGYSAVQGTTARNDNDEAFDTHPDCRARFFGKVADQPTLNVINRGATVPMEFTLGRNHGLDILASNSPHSRQVDCTTRRTVGPGPLITPRPLPVPTETPGNSRLSYDARTDRYTYPWKTLNDWAGTCREFVLTRTDGTQHRAYFRIAPSEPPTEPPESPVSQVWEARYNGPGSEDDFARAMGVSADGARVFVTGQSPGENADADYATVAYNAATGSELWVARHNGPASLDDIAHALGVSPDGARVFVTGLSLSAGTGTDSDYATVAYDAASGEELWVARYDGPAGGIDGAFALGVSPDGARVFVTGLSPGTGAGADYATVAYDAATGNQLWAARYNGPASGADFAQALGVSPDGAHVMVTGGSPGTGSSGDYATVAYDAATGSELWVARYNGPASGADAAEALGASADGARVFVTGGSPGAGSGSDYATVAYDAATGSELWVARHNGPASGLDVANALGVSPDGTRVFVTGRSTGTSADYATVAYDAATGTERWIARYNGPASGADFAQALGVSADGAHVFVTGQSVGVGTESDHATVAYDAAGDELWAARYDGPARDVDAAQALGASADGARVFVTGDSASTTTGVDYATVAYDLLNPSEGVSRR